MVSGRIRRSQALVEDVRRDEAVHGARSGCGARAPEMIYVLASAAMIDLDGRKLMLFQAMDITEPEERRKGAERARRAAARAVGAPRAGARGRARPHRARNPDEMGQELTALKMDLSVMGLESGADSPRIKEQVASLKRGGRPDPDRAGCRDHSLRPAALDLGILSGVEWLVEEFRKRSGIGLPRQVESEDIDLAEDRQASSVSASCRSR